MAKTTSSVGAHTVRSSPLDRARPLWRLDIIPGLPEGRVGVLLVLHHVVADGLRGVAPITSLLESTHQPRVDGGMIWRPKPAPTALDLVLDNLRPDVEQVIDLMGWHLLPGVTRGQPWESL